MEGSQTTLTTLFRRIEDSFPEKLGPDGWYLLTASSVVACGKPQVIADLYKYLIAKPAFSTPTQRKQLSRKLRDVLLKEWTLIGIPLVITAFAALAGVEKEEDADWISTMSAAQLDEATEQRGTAFVDQIYQHDLEPILSTFASHRADVEWLVKKVIYGLFLSDHTLLSAIDAELVIVSAIWCQGLKGPTMWHLRGLRRFGGSLQDLEGVQTAVQLVAGWSGKDTTDWLKVNEVKEIQNL